MLPVNSESIEKRIVMIPDLCSSWMNWACVKQAASWANTYQLRFHIISKMPCIYKSPRGCLQLLCNVLIRYTVVSIFYFSLDEDTRHKFIHKCDGIENLQK